MIDLEIELRYARAAIWEVAKMGGEYPKLVLQYIGWFAPVNDKLSFEQIYAHLIQVSEIWNDCTAEQWQCAIKQMLIDKQAGSLKMPLTDHLILEDYLALFTDSQRQPENNTDPVSVYPTHAQLTTKPKPPTLPTAEQKANAHQVLQQLSQMCSSKGNRKLYSPT